MCVGQLAPVADFTLSYRHSISCRSELLKIFDHVASLGMPSAAFGYSELYALLFTYRCFISR
jgi:hypothetical protein